MKIVPAEESTDEYLPEDELTRIPFNPNLIDVERRILSGAGDTVFENIAA